MKAWAAILQRVGGSKLTLKHNNAGDLAAQTFFFKAFESLGIERDRILISPVMPEHRMHLDSYAELDIGLDPFPYNGTTTTMEALAMGVPVLTLEGHTHVSRVGVSLLSRVGLQDWVASSADDYVARAVSHAGDRVSLARLRPELRCRLTSCPLGQPVVFARQIEDAYRAMWRKWACGN
jgi:predicted O-linked N-acetylglucosamine transferase (SPINDLY family)